LPHLFAQNYTVGRTRPAANNCEGKPVFNNVSACRTSGEFEGKMFVYVIINQQNITASMLFINKF